METDGVNVTSKQVSRDVMNIFFITTRHNPVSFQLFKISFDSNLGEALAYYLP